MSAAPHAHAVLCVRAARYTHRYRSTHASPIAHGNRTPYATSEDVGDVFALKSLRRSPFSEECLFVIATIIQHEAGSFTGTDVWNFMADQLTYDAARLGCGNLTGYRWAIKSRPRPIPAVQLAARRWPRTYPKCSLIGMVPDLSVWRSHGYLTRVDYTFSDGRFTIVGVNCRSTAVPKVRDLKQLKHDFDN